MKKTELKTGMLLKTRTGQMGIVMTGMTQQTTTDFGSFTDAVVSDGKDLLSGSMTNKKRHCAPLNQWNDDLTSTSTTDDDIVEVWEAPSIDQALVVNTNNRTQLYQRPITASMTWAEIEAKLGMTITLIEN